MKEVLEIIAKALVDNPDMVNITEVNNEDNSITLELRVAENDMGKVIGRQGKIAKALRTLVKSGTKRGEKKINLEIKSKSEI